MREIKFRAWDGKKMLENVGIMNGNACIWKPAPKSSAEFTVVVNGETHFGYSDWDAIVERPEFILMQFAGLHDKNGKEIYEGDIVRFHYFYGSLGSGGGFCEEEHEITGVISWGTLGWGVSKIKGEHWRGYTGFQDGEGESSFMELMAMNESGVHEESFEVIGNIHENPELLEAK